MDCYQREENVIRTLPKLEAEHQDDLEAEFYAEFQAYLNAQLQAEFQAYLDAQLQA